MAIEGVVLGWPAWLTLGVLVGTIVLLATDRVRPYLAFLGALGFLLLAGVVSPDEAFRGFSNPAVLTVAALFVVAAGVQQTNALAAVDRLVFSRGRSRSAALARMMGTTAALSAFLNNTPIVAMLTPRVQSLASPQRPASKFLIPLSYAAIVGGMTTLVGTSTNIVVSGLLEAAGHAPLGMFTLTWVGLPVALGIVLWMSLVGHRMLPDRATGAERFEDGLRDCLFEVRVARGEALAGQTIEEAGLRNLGNAYLVHLRREGRLIPSDKDEVLRVGDALTFLGDAAVMEQLLERPGLEGGLAPVHQADFSTLPLYEAVVAESSTLVGRTLKEAQFRERYGGVVLGIQRRNEQVDGPLGRVPIRSGDLLIVEARNGFDERWRAQREEFLLVAPRRPSRDKVRAAKAPLALALLAGMVGVVALGWLPIVTAAFATALAMVLLRCLSGRQARAAVDLEVIIVIAAALGLGQAVEASGLALAVAHGMLGLTAPLGPLAVLAALYLTTNLLTELISNNAAAALMVGVALAAAADLGVEPRVAVVVVAIAASASFMTPIGYQTNLMVMAPGGYRLRDFARVGLPVSLIAFTLTLAAVWLRWF